ncbi:ArnT family glycosyltransferase [Streptomyces natalensis]|nr:glycosyltransferase family 39 protein [Streptomyces natalensis]
MTSPHAAAAARPHEPRWARPALVALLVATAALYLWNLSANGYANQFYSAAVQAGSESWKAFFFGSSDAANSITVDKPPASLWPMALSVRLFGLGSWAILVPEVLMGVAAVGVLYAAVRRRFGAAAGLLAGGVLALTPVAALMFRFNNPDALLCLLMVCAIAAVLRALADGRTKWLVLAGLCFGLGFLTKTLQAWLILPALAAVYACCAPVAIRRRLGQLLLGGLAMVLSGGWWVAAVELWPASSRPYIGGSQHNSFLELTFGYNGFGRITGNETGSVGGGGGGHRGGIGGGGWGQTGITRLFSADMGGQIAWLLPAALILLVAAVCVLWRARRSVAAGNGEQAGLAERADQPGDADQPGHADQAGHAEQAAQREEFLVWGGALLSTFVTFSFMSGIFHQYYNIALAPYVAALVAMGATLLWRRGGRLASVVLAGTVAVTAVWSYVLLDRSPNWLPWLRWTVLALGLLAALGLLLPALRSRAAAGDAADGDAAEGDEAAATAVPSSTPSRPAAVAAGLAVVTALAGPLAYVLDTVQTPKGGSIITAGPQVRGSFGGPGGGRFPGGMRQFNGKGRSHAFPGGTPGGPGGFPGRGATGGPGGHPGGMGGLLNGAKVSAQAKALVAKDADRYTWAAAAVGSQNAASYQLATQKPVMAIGGFNGSDPSPTLAQFKRDVADGKIHYFIAGGRDGFGGKQGPGSKQGPASKQGPGGNGRNGQRNGNGRSSKITSWIEKTFKKVTVGGATFYDLTQPRQGGKAAGQ